MRARFVRKLPVTAGIALLLGVGAFTAAGHSPLGPLTLVSASGTTHCSGTLAPGEYHAVEVAKGHTCTIGSSVKVDSDVTVDSDATLNDLGADVGHNINAGKRATLNIRGTTGYEGSFAKVGHDINADAVPEKVTIVDTHVGHEIEIEGATGSVRIESDSVANDLQVTSAKGPVDVSNNHVGHNLIIEHDTGSTTVDDNTVGHNATCNHNPMFSGSGNTAGHSNTCNM